LPFPAGSSNWALYLASFAFSIPRWCSVAWKRLREKKKESLRQRKYLVALCSRDFCLNFFDLFEDTHILGVHHYSCVQ
jgi:hypothetical protein